MANVNEAKKHHFIYKTTNLLNGKYYVGMHSTSNLEDGYLGSGKRLRYSIRKYGESNFKLEILEFLSTREKLVRRERELVNEDLIRDLNCLNLKPGGNGGWINENHQRKATQGANKKRLELLATDPEFKKAYSKTCTERNKKLYESGVRKSTLPNWKGKKQRPEVVEQRKETFKKIEHQKGEKNSQYGTQWINNGEVNKKIQKTDIAPTGWKLGRINLKKD